MRSCADCGNNKNDSEFRVLKGKYFLKYCRVCERLRAKRDYFLNHEEKKEYQRMMYQKNKKKRLNYVKKYREDNYDIVREKDRKYKKDHYDELVKKSRKKYYENRENEIAKVRDYQKRYPEKIRQYYKDRRKKDIAFCLRVHIRSLIWKCLNGEKKGRSVKKLLGYSIKDLMLHLENQFVKGMDWKNYGSKWHIDHRIPLSTFDIKGVDDQFLKAWSLDNLQPKWAIDNLKKNNKYSEPSLIQIFKEVIDSE